MEGCNDFTLQDRHETALLGARAAAHSAGQIVSEGISSWGCESQRVAPVLALIEATLAQVHATVERTLRGTDPVDLGALGNAANLLFSIGDAIEHALDQHEELDELANAHVHAVKVVCVSAAESIDREFSFGFRS